MGCGSSDPTPSPALWVTAPRPHALSAPGTGSSPKDTHRAAFLVWRQRDFIFPLFWSSQLDSSFRGTNFILRETDRPGL